MNRPRIGIVIGTTRRGRFGDKPAAWIERLAAGRDDIEVEIVDLRDYALPLFDEPLPPIFASAVDSSAIKWCEKVASLDGYIFITAEYNHSISGALKNALDFPYAEFNKKPASFVGYGNVGGARAVQHLRQIAVELELAPLRNAVHIGLDEYRAVTSDGRQLAEFDHLNAAGARLLDEIAWWSSALKTGRGAIQPIVA